jgi:hypothetical protein
MNRRQKKIMGVTIANIELVRHPLDANALLT